jgi:hypothetical protein
VIVEQVTGPFGGYYIAMYACQMGELGREWLAYYKISRTPVPFFEADGNEGSGCCPDVLASADAAMERAECLALNRITVPSGWADMAHRAQGATCAGDFQGT